MGCRAHPAAAHPAHPDGRHRAGAYDPRRLAPAAGHGRRVGGHAPGRGTGSPGRPCDGRRLPGHSMPLGEGWAPSGMTLVGPGVGARSARGRARTPVPRRDVFSDRYAAEPAAMETGSRHAKVLSGRWEGSQPSDPGTPHPHRVIQAWRDAKKTISLLLVKGRSVGLGGLEPPPSSLSANAGNRCAEGPFGTSRSTVEAEAMCSRGVQLGGLLVPRAALELPLDRSTALGPVGASAS